MISNPAPETLEVSEVFPNFKAFGLTILYLTSADSNLDLLIMKVITLGDC